MGKPDILTLTEMQLMQRHPSYSRLILEALPGLEEVALWVGAHHERPDGKGYPEMLTTDVIPLESRIIAVANVYVALTSDRPYRRRAEREGCAQGADGRGGDATRHASGARVSVAALSRVDTVEVATVIRGSSKR